MFVLLLMLPLGQALGEEPSAHMVEHRLKTSIRSWRVPFPGLKLLQIWKDRHPMVDRRAKRPV